MVNSINAERKASESQNGGSYRNVDRRGDSDFAAFRQDGGWDCSSTKESNLPACDETNVLYQLEQLIISEDWLVKAEKDPQKEGGMCISPSRKGITETDLSEISRMAVTSLSLKAYISLLRPNHRQSIAALIYGNTSMTLSNLFRFPNGEVHCSDSDHTLLGSDRNSIGHAVKLAILDAYGLEYCIQGWKAFSQLGSPVVYVSPGLDMNLASYLTSEFGISDIIVLKKENNALADLEGRIDYDAFESQLKQDMKEGRKPLIVIGIVGSTILGQNDPISRIITLRSSKTNFWIHVIGQGMAALCTKQAPEGLATVLSQVDSMTLPLATWLDIKTAPTLTLHRPLENYRIDFKKKLDILPWWIAIEHLKPSMIMQIIENAYTSSQLVLRGLASMSQMDIIGIENPTEFLNRLEHGLYMASTVLFRYKYAELEEFRKSNVSVDTNVSRSVQEEMDRADAEKELSDYANALNYWPKVSTCDDEILMKALVTRHLHRELTEFVDHAYGVKIRNRRTPPQCTNIVFVFQLGQELATVCMQMELKVIKLDEKFGTVIRYGSLEASKADVTSINKFFEHLKESLEILESTVSAKKRFNAINSNYTSLMSVPLSKWAGIGAVCFIPSVVKDVPPDQWSEKQKQQISYVNAELVHALRSLDAAFSLGKCTTFDVSCVRFGMLSDRKDLSDLIDLVCERGKEIEESQKYLDSLAKMILQGIEAANSDLKREKDERLMQEGVIRQIPLMSSFINWISPLSPQNKKGRSFDLKTGTIQSTALCSTIGPDFLQASETHGPKLEKEKSESETEHSSALN